LWLSSSFIGNDCFNLPTSRHGGHRYPFEGYISNLSILTGALSLGEVQEVYNGGHPASLYELSIRDQVIAWYPLGDGVGQFIEYDDIGPGVAFSSEYSMIRKYTTQDCINLEHGYTGYQNHGHIFRTNIVYDMVGNMHGVPTSSMTTTASLADNTGTNFSLWTVVNMRPNIASDSYVPLLGRSQVRTEFADDFKVGALYSRRVPEYVGTPWPVMQITDFMESLPRPVG
jgi:hypothetical protein